MGKGDVTLKDIAKVVGKSVAAVSKALNDHEDISLETRDLVKEVALSMGYRPNITAQRLQKRRTDTIALVLPVLSSRRADPFFVELLSGIADEATLKGFDLLVSTRSPGPEEHRAYHRLIDERHVDGVIITQPRRNDWRLDYLTKQATPFVAVGQFNPEAAIPGVWIDVVHGLSIALNHLIAQGRQHIALIPPSQDLRLSEVCLQAFERLLKQNPQIRGQVSVEIKALEHQEGYRAAQILLSQADFPDAIIACHDLLALGTLAAAQDQGFEIGNDIAIVGVGDSLLAQHAHPPLTTVHQPTYAVGQRVCDMLIDLIVEKPLSETQVVIEPWLVLRQSSDLSLWV